MCIRDSYDDFILEFEVQVSSGLNSGVQFRSLKSDNSRNSVYGYQIELEADKPERNRSWSGGIYDQSRRSIFYIRYLLIQLLELHLFPLNGII